MSAELRAEDCCGREDWDEGGEAYVCDLPAGHIVPCRFVLKLTAGRRPAPRRSWRSSEDDERYEWDANGWERISGPAW